MEGGDPCDAVSHMAEPLWALVQETKRAACPLANGTHDMPRLHPATTVCRGDNPQQSPFYPCYYPILAVALISVISRFNFKAASTVDQI